MIAIMEVWVQRKKLIWALLGICTAIVVFYLIEFQSDKSDLPSVQPRAAQSIAAQTIASSLQAAAKNSTVNQQAHPLESTGQASISARAPQSQTSTSQQNENELQQPQKITRQSSMSQILPGDDQQRIASSSPSVAQAASAMPHNEQSQEQDRNRRFIKIDISGKALADDASEWACVYDIKTQLLWEHNIGMPHDLRYRWSEPSENNVQPETCPYFAGKTTGEIENCTASLRASVVNRLQLCGSSAWQLPSIAELQTIILPNHYNPAVDTRYFPYTQSDYYWAREGVAYSEFNAWAVSFAGGKDNDVPKTEFVFVRLVSGASLNGDL